MERLALAVGLIAVAVLVAAVVQRRAKPASPAHATPPDGPRHVDRGDFARTDAPWLVVAFSSTSCLSCAGTWEKVAALESNEVAVEDVSFQTRRDLHERYAVDSVPLVLVADADGLVRATFLGPPPAADLWSKLAELRET
jgi:hypothetical protein